MNTPSSRIAARSHPPKGVAAALLLILLALVGPARARGGDRLPQLGDCQNLQVPAGNMLTAHAVGVGVHIYSWNGTQWNFVSPEAALFAADVYEAGFGVVIAFHDAGPTRVDLAGSTVVGSSIQSCTPNPGVIPWLLLDAASHTGGGPFGRVTFVQRLNTAGGLAPATPGTAPGQVVRVPYSADYYFYQKSS